MADRRAGTSGMDSDSPDSARTGLARRWTVVGLVVLCVYILTSLTFWLFVLPGKERIIPNPFESTLDGRALSREQIEVLMAHAELEAKLWSAGARWELQSRRDGGLSFIVEEPAWFGLSSRRSIVGISPYGPEQLTVTLHVERAM